MSIFSSYMYIYLPCLHSYYYTEEKTQSPHLVLFHSFTNDIKRYEPNQCVDKMDKIISVVHQEWPHSKLIISLATPRVDEFCHYTNGQILNALLKQHFHENHAILPLYHACMLHEGDLALNLLCDDGVSLLASSMKRAIHGSLGIETVSYSRSRSKNRANNGFGRNRGYSVNIKIKSDSFMLLVISDRVPH